MSQASRGVPQEGTEQGASAVAPIRKLASGKACRQDIAPVVLRKSQANEHGVELEDITLCFRLLKVSNEKKTRAIEIVQRAARSDADLFGIVSNCVGIHVFALAKGHTEATKIIMSGWIPLLGWVLRIECGHGLNPFVEVQGLYRKTARSFQ